ncbi:MAG TPA: PilZ domain-containing protein [Thermoanaerobaculia bacterium]|nr:PilZ domain-containing protein [Thermoanaerobaculia bacterium]
MMRDEPGRILLVDHSRGTLLFAETLLRRRETSISTAVAGSEGLARARLEKPCLIIFGYDLFDMTAPEFCREIRSDEATRHMSLLLIADREAPEQADLAVAAGCNDVIYRPLQRRELDRKVAKLTSIPVRKRLRTMTRVEISLEGGGRFLLGRSLNISANGMLLEIDRVLPGNGVIRVSFYLPGDPRPLQLDAEVLRAEFVGTIAKYGLRFMNPTEEDQSRIERYVERLRSRETI